MNSNLNEAIFDTAKVNALMYAYERTFLDMEFLPEDMEKADMGVNAFYAIWDMVHKIAEDLDRLAGDSTVVDAIYAVNDVQRRSTLKTEE
jgi:hypothetical protein